MELLPAKNNKYLKSVHVEFTEKKLQYHLQIVVLIQKHIQPMTPKPKPIVI